MTAIATMIGSVPLLIATGPGATARQSLGTAIVGGMCVATVLSLFVVPVLYITIKTLALRYLHSPKAEMGEGELGSDRNGEGEVRDKPSAIAQGDGYKER
jgi:hydrophobic/amphiphilic exporter-1 (mainly G- bacteria), HAE1 family